MLSLERRLVASASRLPAQAQRAYSYGLPGGAGSSSGGGDERPRSDHEEPRSKYPRDDKNLDQLWKNALSAPAAALRRAPKVHARSRSLLASSTPTPRVFKGTIRRNRRSEGQTPHEAGTFNATLGKILNNLVNKSWDVDGSNFSVPLTARGKSLSHLSNPPDAWRRSAPRVEDDDAALVAEIDGLKEELAGLHTPSEAVTWAQAKVFARSPDALETPSLPGGETPRTTWPRTYPRALAALINTLWMRMNVPHLALAMFEHARTLSIESYLAGCQTSAYNELVRVQWEAFHDLNAVFATVQEMDTNAVAWDRYTAGFVGNIVDSAGRELMDSRMRSATHRWGGDAFQTLAKLEEFVAADRQREEDKYERRSDIKRRVRQGHLSM